MPKNLISFTLGALDEFERIQHLQEVIQLCLEELGTSYSDQAHRRVDTLLGLYTADMRLRLDELRVNLEGLRKHIGAAALGNEEGEHLG